MTNNLNQITAQGVRYIFWGGWVGNYVYGTDITLANTETSSLGRLKGLQTLGTSTPEAPIINQTGDNGLIASFMTNPTEGPSGNTALGAFDQNFDVFATNTAIKAVGPYDEHIASNRCYEFAPLFIVVNSPAVSQESGSVGEAGWQVVEYMYAFAQPLSLANIAQNTAHTYTHRLIFNERGVHPWGATILDADYGLTQGWQKGPYWSPYPITYQTYIGSGGAAQTVTLSETPAAASGNALQIWDNGAALVYTTNYAVVTATKIVTFVGTDPAAAHVAVMRYQFVPSC